MEAGQRIRTITITSARHRLNTLHLILKIWKEIGDKICPNTRMATRQQIQKLQRSGGARPLPTITHSASFASISFLYFNAYLHLSDSQVTPVFLFLTYAPTFFRPPHYQDSKLSWFNSANLKPREWACYLDLFFCAVNFAINMIKHISKFQLTLISISQLPLILKCKISPDYPPNCNLSPDYPYLQSISQPHQSVNLSPDYPCWGSREIIDTLGVYGR